MHCSVLGWKMRHEAHGASGVGLQFATIGHTEGDACAGRVHGDVVEDRLVVPVEGVNVGACVSHHTMLVAAVARSSIVGRVRER